MSVMTMTEFLLARIAEDEARECGDARPGSARETGARVRAGSRRLAAGLGATVREGRLVPMAADMASAYSDHPDYDPAWRP